MLVYLVQGNFCKTKYSGRIIVIFELVVDSCPVIDKAVFAVATFARYIDIAAVAVQVRGAGKNFGLFR